MQPGDLLILRNAHLPGLGTVSVFQSSLTDGNDHIICAVPNGTRALLIELNDFDACILLPDGKIGYVLDVHLRRVLRDFDEPQ
jgi:hypothetical protein